MARQRSFAKIEQEIRRGYRNNLNIANSAEEVKKFFHYAVREFFLEVFQGEIMIDFDDVRMDARKEGGVAYSEALMSNGEFRQALDDSDLPRIMGELAGSGLNRIKHLEEKQPDKTENKPFQTHSGAGRSFKSRT